MTTYEKLDNAMTSQVDGFTFANDSETSFVVYRHLGPILYDLIETDRKKAGNCVLIANITPDRDVIHDEISFSLFIKKVALSMAKPKDVSYKIVVLERDS